MKVEISSKAGFCFGVRRARSIAYETLALSRGDKDADLPVFTLGPLVHNPQVVAALERDGITSISQIGPRNRGYLVIRSHGVSPPVLQEAKESGFKIVDATCPLVQRIHRVVKTLKSESYRIVIVGRRDHPEVMGIMGYAGDDCIVVEEEEDLDLVPRSRKLGVVAQTTAISSVFHTFACRLLKKAAECRIFNTICFETTKRQEATLKLAGGVEAMVVVGGRNSSNAAKLVEICKKTGTRTFHVETAEELDPSWFRSISLAGLAAGTSTPPETIQEVAEKLKAL